MHRAVTSGSQESLMASPMTTTIPRQEVTALVRQVQGNQLFNRQLSSVCQVNGLKSTGVKADLQRRIIDLIQDTVNANDVSRFHQLRHSISNAIVQRGGPSKPGSSRGVPPLSQTSSSSHPPFSMPSYGQPSTPSRDYRAGASLSNGYRSGGSSYSSPSTPHLTFRTSPFYHIEASVGSMRPCEVMSQHRNTININIKLSDHPCLQACVDDKSYRVMVFCATDVVGVQDIAFPHQSELRINGGEFKANLRGLKNKPGSTRPVDITSVLRLRSTYSNNVDFTYALTNKKFYLLVNLCRVTPVSELVSTISTRRRIPKESVVAELNKKAQDPDIVATSQVLSLKCPLSYMRLDVPCRSLSCTHIQCFDGTSYLQLQEQGPQWLCPICNKPAPFEKLAVDEYVKDILENTPKTLETVTIEPNGRWFQRSSQSSKANPSQSASFGEDDDDDDDLEISEVNLVGGRRLETPKHLTPSTGTPVSGGRGSVPGAVRNTAPTSSKRPASAVIDLTLSSDDEEPIQRPRKRQNTGTTGYRDSTGLGFLSDSPNGFLP